MHIRGEHRIIIVIDHHRRIGPPQEGLRKRSTVIYLDPNLKIRLAGTECKSLHAFQAEHAFHFVAPQCFATVLMVFNETICGQEGTGTVMLGPVKLNTSRNPRSGQSHKSRLHHLIVINEVPFPDLVVCHLYTASQFGQDHNFQIFVFQEISQIRAVMLFIFYLLYYRIGINHPGTALIDTFLQENRILFLFAYGIGG